MQCQYASGHPIMVPYTPSANVAAGDVIIVGEMARIAHLDIAANALGAVAVGNGVYAVKCLDLAGIPDGLKVYWDDGSNGVTKDMTAGGAPFGFAIEAGVYNGIMMCVHQPSVS